MWADLNLECPVPRQPDVWLGALLCTWASSGAVLSGRCAACLMATGHAERLMHVQGKQIKSKEIMRPRLAAGMQMDDICRNNRVNRSEVIVDVTYRRERERCSLFLHM